jgi:hypothetical protein
MWRLGLYSYGRPDGRDGIGLGLVSLVPRLRGARWQWSWRCCRKSYHGASRKWRALSASLLETNKDLEIGAISFFRISKVMTKECRQGGCVIRGSNMRPLMI